MPDPVHMCMAIPPKDPVSSVIGFGRGRVRLPLPENFVVGSAISFGSIFGHSDMRYPPLGLSSQVRQYIRAQEEADGSREPV